MAPDWEISAVEAKQRLDAGEPVVLIDVRRQEEFDLARISEARLIPMDTVPQELSRLEALAEERTLIVYCHHGVRSLQVVNWLRGQGVENCVSMSGGIEAWSLTVDPTVPRY
jgi:rhodanese-related sulfurtransferase